MKDESIKLSYGKCDRKIKYIHEKDLVVIGRKILWHPSFFSACMEWRKSSRDSHPFCPQSNEPVNITGFHILKVPAFKVSLYGGNLFWWIAAHKYQVVRIMLSFKTEQIQIPDIAIKYHSAMRISIYRMRDVAYVIAIPLLKHTLRFNDD